MKTYRAQYTLYVPKLELEGWSPAETINYEVTYRAKNYMHAVELAGTYMPFGAEIADVSVY